MNKLFIIFAVLIMSGCVVVSSKVGIGSNINDAMIKHGSSYWKTEQGDGLRTYEWRDNYEVRNPGLIYETSKTRKSKHGPGVIKETSNFGYGTRNLKKSCRYRYKAKYNQKRDEWLITSIEITGNGCRKF